MNISAIKGLKCERCGHEIELFGPLPQVGFPFAGQRSPEEILISIFHKHRRHLLWGDQCKECSCPASIFLGTHAIKVKDTSTLEKFAKFLRMLEAVKT